MNRKKEIRGFLLKIKVKLVIFIFGILMIFVQSGYGQQYPIFTQYMFNGLVLNPAYTGSHESMAFTAASRSQWTDLKGAPQTEMFTVHSPIKFSRSAAGAFFTLDRLGKTKQYMLYGTYAYRFPVSRKGKIAIGGQFGVTYYQTDYTGLNIVTRDNSPDPSFSNNNNRYLPNIGTGVYYYDDRLYVGLASPSVINNKFNKDNGLEIATQERHYFLTAGYIFDLNENLKLKPNLLIKWVENGVFQYDINSNLLIRQTVWVGFSYRMNDSVDGLFGWNINDQLAIGYSYGYPVNSLSSFLTGTHELSLNYRLKRDRNIIQSPRYF